jgi:uncharacterized membrane protein YbhN (UPF0104 family)
LDLDFVMQNEKVRWMASTCLFITIGMSVCLAIGFSKKLDKILGLTHNLRKFSAFSKLVRVFEAMQMFGKQRIAIVLSIFVSLVAQTVSVALFVYVGSVLGSPLPWAAYMFCVPLGFVATALPIAPAGVGVGQVAFLFLFETYAKSSADTGAAAITAFQLFMLVWGLIGSICYIRYRGPVSLREIESA